MLNHPSANPFAIATSTSTSGLGGSELCSAAIGQPPPAHQHRPQMGSSASSSLLNGASIANPLDSSISTSEAASIASHPTPHDWRKSDEFLQANPWQLMGLMPQQGTAMQQQCAALPPRGGFFGDPSAPLPMRYPGVEENTAKDHVNSTFYQFQDLDMIASIVAKEQAMLKVNSAARVDQNSLANLALPHRHPQVIVNGSRENLSSSPSEMSPTSCSPSSSDTIQSARRTNNNNTSSNNNNSSNSTANANNLRTNGHLQQQSRSANGNTVQNGNADTGNENGLNRQTSGNDSPIDVTGVSSLLSNHPLKQEPHFDMSGILGMGQLNGHLQNAAALNSNSATDHLLASSASLSSPFAGLSYDQHHHHHNPHQNGSTSAQVSRTGTANGNASSATNAANASNTANEASVSSAPTMVPRSTRHRSTPHDGLIKCNYCPKKWADQALLRVHMEECRVMRMHECQQCGKRFKARGGLQQHLRIHSNDRPYQCHYCPKRFTQKSHVDQHERIHTGAKPFSCQFCGRSFRQRSQQMGHEATHANGVLSIAATIANQQQQQLTHLSNQSPINTNSEHHSPRTPDGSSPVSQQQRVQQQQQQQQHQSQTSQQQQNLSTQPSSTSNNPNVTDSSDLLGSPNGVGLMSQSAVTSLLALSQGANSAAVAQASMNSLQMPPGMQPQTLASVLAARSCGV